MRIGFDVSPLVFPTPLGVVRATRGLVDALERRGVLDVVRLVPERGTSSLAWRQRELPRLVRALDLGGLHSPVSAFPLVLDALVVATVHEVPWLVGARERAGLAPRFWASVPASAATLCPSEFTARALARHRGHDRRVVVAPWGVDDEFATVRAPFESRVTTSASRSSRETSDAAQEGSESESSGTTLVDAVLAGCRGLEQRRFVLCPGATRAKKNLAAVLRGVAELDRIDAPRLSVVVTGHATEDSVRDRALARSLGLGERIFELGVISEAELAALYRSCACVAVLSQSEGFAFPVVEALAAGAPVLVPHASAAAETAGGEGVLVDAGDARAVALGLREALASRDARRSARIAHAAQFTWDRCAARVEELWRSLA